MLDSDWTHIIEDIVSKNPQKRSKYHDLIIGKRCFVPDEQEMPYYIGAMIVEAFGSHASSRWFYTTKVVRLDKSEDGSVEMETENSIYKFKAIQGGELCDLSGQCRNNTDRPRGAGCDDALS